MTGSNARIPIRILVAIAAVAGVASWLAVKFVDEPLARFVHTLPWATGPASETLSFPILILTAGIIVLIGARQNWATMPARKLFEPAIVASFSLTWSVCINEFLLKRIFGRKTPGEYLATGKDVFHWFQGFPTSSFPSGHAVQILSVGVVLAAAYPRFRIASIVLMGVGLIALLFGNWHFLADIIAGSAFGAIGAMTTMALWQQQWARGS